MDIKNYLKIDPFIQTSGQPTNEQYEWIRSTGVSTIINLAVPKPETLSDDEALLVTKLGMNYLHMPVTWDKPEPARFELFSTIMKAHENTHVWIHCALNWRVSSFVYLYRTTHQGIAETIARADLEKIWQPDEVWSAFIADHA